jgi:hypothetical protein
MSVETAKKLREAIEEGLAVIRGADDASTTKRPAPGKWCAREILGHLIDSACNNHRRFVLGHGGKTARWDGYVQDEWVGSQHYADESWGDLVALWSAYNRHLAHVMARTPAEVSAYAATSPDGDGPVTVGYLMDDYVRHLRHHLGQIRSLLA